MLTSRVVEISPFKHGKTAWVAKQFVDVPNRKRSPIFKRLHGKVKPLPFDKALTELISRIGPVRLHTLRLYVSRPVEELADTLRELERRGSIARVVALQPDPTDYYSSHEDAEKLLSPMQEDRKMRILAQSDPFSSRFIQEVRSKAGLVLPCLQGGRPHWASPMFVVNDYLEIKDINIPHSR